MKFDFTDTPELTGKNYRHYRQLQVALYLLAILGGLYFAFLVFFPEKDFVFSFLNPNASSNNIADPRDLTGAPLISGQTPDGQTMLFDAAAAGDFSTIVSSFSLAKSASVNPFTIHVRRAYRAFLSPQGAPLGFRDGSLLKNNTDFYLVSDGALRKFANATVREALGFSENAFLSVTPVELSYNPRGEDIQNTTIYPDASLFQVADNYYILVDQKMRKFVDAAAFQSYYDFAMALPKNQAFLAQYTILPDPLGFADGSLISYGESVYVLSGNQFFPIDNPVTFAELGYSWDDVVASSADVLALYTKGRLLNIKSVHPDNTTFRTIEDNSFFLIQGGVKKLLPTEKIARSWFRRTPVVTSQKGLEVSASCVPQKSILRATTYTCPINIEALRGFPGNNYEFELREASEEKINQINLTFQKAVNVPVFKQSARTLINGIITNYATLAR